MESRPAPESDSPASDPPASELRARAHHVAAAALLLVLAGSLADVASAPWRLAQVDEGGWISSGYRTFQLVLDAAPPAEWRRVYAEEANPTYFDLNPPVSKLWAGGLAALFRQPDDPVRYYWAWPGNHATNTQAGNLPPLRLLHGVRLGFVVVALGTLALVYALAVQVTGARWLALLAPVALYLSPIFRMQSTQVCLEGPQIFLLAAGVLAFNRHLTRGGWVAFGISLLLMGLACAAKLNAAPLVLAAGLFVALRSGPLAPRLARAVAVGVVPLAVFVAVNPFFWDDPPGRIQTLLSDWSTVKEIQRADPALSDRRVGSPAEGLWLVARETLTRPSFDHRNLRGLAGPAALVALSLLLLALYRYRFDWGALLRPAERASLAGLAALLTVGWLLGAVGPSALLLCAGLFFSLGPRGAGDPRRTRREPAAFVATAAALMIVMTGLWLPHAWARYYLPTLLLLPPFYVAAAQMLAAVAETRSPRRAAPAAILHSRP